MHKSRSDDQHKRGLVPATSPLKSLHEGTGRGGLFHGYFTQSVLRNISSRDRRRRSQRNDHTDGRLQCQDWVR